MTKTSNILTIIAATAITLGTGLSAQAGLNKGGTDAEYDQEPNEDVDITADHINGDPCTVDFLGAASEEGTWHNYGGVWACDTASGSYARQAKDPDDTFSNEGIGNARENGDPCTVNFLGAASEDGTWHNYGGVWACDTASGSYA